MPILVGLGNPGNKYRNNRHNVGFQFIDYIAKLLHCQIVKKDLSSIIYHLSSNFILANPQTFMNNSGPAVKKILSNFQTFKLSGLIIIHDDLDIPIGKFKIQKATGPQLHNGIESIEKSLGTKDFWRVRIGVDNRLALSDPERAKRVEGESNGWTDGETYVLQNFTNEEKQQINQLFPTIYQRLKNDKLIP